MPNSGACRAFVQRWFAPSTEAGRASKAAEYADVPPKKFKALYQACWGKAKEMGCLLLAMTP